ncbi:hypothetical protein CH289_07685 [Rhodococcus sp. RS1C4]|nr:hypothetical protein [Rhodococcus sp. RS1C4]OZC55067.1 hypothetical protein CH289_07685 [Rhodococcus sp. RS1C4]
MSDTTATETATSTEDTGTGSETTELDTTTTGETETETSETREDSTIEDPAILRKEISKLRKEAAAARVKGNEKAQRAATESATKAQEELAEKLGRALGLIKDDETLTPEQTIAKLTEERDAVSQRETEAAKKLREYQARDALREAAKTNEGDFVALNDSATLREKLAGIDSTADDYATQVDAAVKSAIASNPKLKAAPVAAGASGIEHGGKVQAAPTGVEAFRKQYREHRGLSD